MNKQLLIAFLLFSTFLSAQEVVSTSGEYFSNTSGSIEFTVGEIAIETISTGSNIITQGFHQTNLGILSVDNFDNDLTINIFPNPVRESLQVSLTNFTDKSYRLFDMMGKLLSEKKLNTSHSEIDLSPYINGIYLLAIYNENNRKIQTYRIIKN